MVAVSIIEEQHKSTSTIKEWTQWHTDLRTLLNLIRNAVEDDHAKRQSARRSGNA